MKPCPIAAGRGMPAAGGYSLTEAVLVLSIAVGALVSTIPSAYSLWHRYALWVAAYEVANELQQARIMAVAGNMSVGWRGETARGLYQLVGPSGAPVGVEHFLPNPVRFERLPRTAIRFHSRGTASPAGSILLAGPGGRARVVVGLAGRIRVEWDGKDED